MYAMHTTAVLKKEPTLASDRWKIKLNNRSRGLGSAWWIWRLCIRLRTCSIFRSRRFSGRWTSSRGCDGEGGHDRSPDLFEKHQC